MDCNQSLERLKIGNGVQYQLECWSLCGGSIAALMAVFSLIILISSMEAHLHMIKKETQDCTSRCSAEAKTMLEATHVEARDLDIMEREAADVLKASELKLQDAIK